MERKAEGGYIIVMVAIFLVFMLALVALAVDLGMAYSARTQNQAAADAGALGGAVEFLNPVATKTSIETYAAKIAIANKTLGAAIQPGDVTANADIANRRVTVDITRTEPTFFAKIMGFNSIQVHTQGIAEAADHASGGPCMKPVFIPNTLGAVPPCGPGGGCTNSNKLLDVNGHLTTYGESIRGTEFTMKPQAPGGAINPSDFYELDLPGPTSNYPDALGNCIDPATLSCQTTYPVSPGNRPGPTTSGINQLIGYPPTDQYYALGDYIHADGLHYSTSRALASAPIVDLCGYPGFCPTGQLPSGGGGGRGGGRGGGGGPVLNVVGFAQIFVESVGQRGAASGDVLAKFINAWGCDTGGGPPGATGSAVAGVPIRLVRAP